MFKWIRRVFFVVLITILIGVGYLTWDANKLYQQAIEEKTLEQQIEEIKKDENYITIDKMPKIYLDAVVCVEDHRFREHGAVDLVSIGRAIVNNLRAGKIVEGGSTITQQLAKNVLFTQEQKFTRKIAEVFAGMDMEKKYSKDEILELYVNTVYFGEGYYGIGEASKGYFDKEPKDMTDYEATILAGIPNAPSAYSLTANPDLAKKRLKKVLSSMVENNSISQEKADEIYEQAK